MPCAASFSGGRWYPLGLGGTRNPRLPWGEVGAMGQWNSGGLIESEGQCSAHGLRASGAQRLCGKDMFSVLQGGEPKGASGRVSAASAAPRRAELRDLLGQPRCVSPGESGAQGMPVPAELPSVVSARCTWCV